VVLILAAAEQGDGFLPRPAAEIVDRLGPDLLPVAPHIAVPGQAVVLDVGQQLAGGGQVAIPFVDLGPADAAGPEAHDQHAAAVGGFRAVIDALQFQHLFP
jgi:hypothetical protein